MVKEFGEVETPHWRDCVKHGGAVTGDVSTFGRWVRGKDSNGSTTETTDGFSSLASVELTGTVH